MQKELKLDLCFFTNKPIILLVYKEAYFNTNDLDSVILSVAVSLM